MKVLPEELGDEEIVKRLGAVREKAMAQDEKIVEDQDKHAFTRFITNYFISKLKT